jgi:hypothetical protein
MIKFVSESLKIPKEQSEAVNRRTDNTMIKGLACWLYGA